MKGQRTSTVHILSQPDVDHEYRLVADFCQTSWREHRQQGKGHAGLRASHRNGSRHAERGLPRWKGSKRTRRTHTAMQLKSLGGTPDLPRAHQTSGSPGQRPACIRILYLDNLPSLQPGRRDCKGGRGISRGGCRGTMLVVQPTSLFPIPVNLAFKTASSLLITDAVKMPMVEWDGDAV